MSATARHIAAIHAEAKKAGFDEDMRRAFMLREVGKNSCLSMTEKEAVRVISALRRQTGSARPGAATASGRYAGILRAMWLNAYHLGVVENKEDKALLAFAKRQTGIAHTQFLTDGAQAAKVIDALKAMMEREAGVDWSMRGIKAKSGAELTYLRQCRIVEAQRRILGKPAFALPPAAAMIKEIAALGRQLRKAAKGRSSGRASKGNGKMAE